MMNYDYFQGMMGGGGWGIMPVMWLTYLLVVTVLVLAIVALLKYISKK